MAANFESGFTVKEPAWHGLGEVIEQAVNAEDALRLAHLDWKVISCPVIVNGKEVEGHKANVRSSDDSVLGLVSNKYKIIQNDEGFAFLNYILEMDVGLKFETAGSLSNGKIVWMLAHLPKEKILDDDIVPYIAFTNGHDGANAVRVCQTPIRIVCENTMNAALRTAKRTWTFRHMGDINAKKVEAQSTLRLTGEYMNALRLKAEELVVKTINERQLEKVLSTVFPIDEDSTERVKANVFQMKDAFRYTWENTDDILNFKNTAWGVYQVAADLATHYTPLRVTRNFKERRFESFLNGNALLDKFQQAVETVA